MKTILITVCGRKRFLEIQFPYLIELKKSKLISEHHLWINTKNEEDLKYIKYIHNLDPNYFKCIYSDEGSGKFEESGTPSVHDVGYMISPFFKYCTDLDTVYIRLDDDICFIETKSFSEYIEFRKSHPEFFLVFPIIVNNCMDFRIFSKSHPFCQSGYEEEKMWRPKGGQIGFHLHKVFLDSYPNLSSIKFNGFVVDCMASINCISWLGSEFAKFNGEVAKFNGKYQKEENWLIYEKPEELGMKNAIFGGMVVCHYSFAHQRFPYNTYFGDGLDLDSTNVLEKYRQISKNIGETNE